MSDEVDLWEEADKLRIDDQFVDINSHMNEFSDIFGKIRKGVINYLHTKNDYMDNEEFYQILYLLERLQKIDFQVFEICSEIENEEYRDGKILLEKDEKLP